MNESEEKTPRALPPHGRPTRYKKYGCRCMACSVRVNRGEEWEGPPSWPIKHLFRVVDEEMVRDDFGADFVELWREQGIEDFEADEVATYYGLWPAHVWPGYLEAGLDFYE